MPSNVFTTIWVAFLLILIHYPASTVHASNIDINYDELGIYLTSSAAHIDSISINGTYQSLSLQNGRKYIDLNYDKEGGLYFLNHPQEKKQLFHISKKKDGSTRIQNLPLWLSLIPPLMAIILALLFKEVIIALFVGIWSGSFIASGLQFLSPLSWIKSLLNVVEKYLINALNDSGHLSVIVFSLLIGGMVAIISKNGGMAGVVKSLSRYAQGPKSSQFITWLLGIAIFFDDYANTLIVGNTMRPVTDKFKVSREKLAYIVDSTAAPVAAVAFITTWIGAELGYISDGIAKIPLAEGQTAYSVFLASLKYSYYPILTLVFILFIIYTNKDYGPMYKAEMRARTTGQVSGARTEAEDEPDMEDLTPVKGAPNKWYYAVFPVLTVIIMTIIGLLYTGFNSMYLEIYPAGNGSYAWSHLWSEMDNLFVANRPTLVAKMGKLIGASDSYIALLWASLSGVIVSLAMTLGGKVMKTIDAMHWMVTGFKTMMPALIILTLAWSLAITTEELHTAEFISNLLEGNISPYLLSAVIFILSALIAFSTGSSWSTMAILYPIAIPTTYAVCHAAGLGEAISTEILLSVIATVLTASVLGDHCSPISDTTILSSLASDCNHIDHVRTQMPYALTVGAFSITSVTVSVYLGGVWWINGLIFTISLVLLYLILNTFGKVTVAPDKDA